MAHPPSCSICGESAPLGAQSCPRDGAALDLGPDPLVGSQLGEYLVQERLGEGGMGFVYRGVHPVSGKPVAIKLLRQEIAGDAEQMRRLVAEARAVNAIRHRGIIDIFGFGQLDGGRQYLVMELLEGTALDKFIAARAPIAPAEALPILEEVTDALRAAHEVGVIHRDLKPSNVFVVSPPHGAPYVKLLDFGLAKLAPISGGVTPQTRSSVLVGTPHYIAPEQARGEPVGPATDLYALGAVAFEMLTGRVPFDGSSPIEIIYRHMTAAPPRASSLLPLPAELDELLLRLMQKRPEQRPASADEVLRELRRIREGVATAPEPQPLLLPKSGKAPNGPAGRRLGLALTLVAVPVAAAALAAYQFWPGGGAARVTVQAGTAEPEQPLPIAKETLAEPAPVARSPAPAVAPAPAAAWEPETTRTRRRSERNRTRAASEPSAGRLRKRLARVQAAWAVERARRPEHDVKIYDFALKEIEQQIAQGKAEELEQAGDSLDDFVLRALKGREP
ncbi:MAG: serine/threonine protein kinase [Myxococcales bacterium]|nr:serine/threonine protein kinase [Myxococcales bacterium]